MKKILVLEIVLLALILIVALWACIAISGNGKTPPETTPATTPSTENTVETTQETVPAWVEIGIQNDLTAQQYFVYDTKTDTFVSASHPDNTRVYPASITKLFTALVALELLDPGLTINAGAELDQVVWGSSVAGIKMGDRLTVEQLVEAMLLPSGNDAAYVLAAAAGRSILDKPEADSLYAVQVFMDTMNGRAKDLGMNQSHFVNPDGIHSDEHYMSFRDLATLGKLCMENKTIMKYASTAVGSNPRFDPDNKSEDAPKQWKNTNALIQEDSEFYCPYAVGLKTGQTPYAGSCLLSAFAYEGNEIIVGVFGCPEVDDRFGDTLQLFVGGYVIKYGQNTVG